MHPSKVTSISACMNNRTMINKYTVKRTSTMTDVIVFIEEVKKVMLSQPYATAAEIQMNNGTEKEVYMLYTHNGKIKAADIEEITISEPTDFAYQNHKMNNPNEIL